MKAERSHQAGQSAAEYLEAELIAAPVARLLVNGQEARILHMSRRSANLVTDHGEIIALTAAGLDPGPFSVVVGPGEQQSFSFEQALGQSYQEMKASIDHGVLRLGQLGILLRQATIWDPTLAQGRLRAVNHDAAVGEIYRLLELCAPAESLPSEFLASGNTELGFRLRRAWDELGSAIERSEPWRCESGARLAAGAGIGLTPAGDDFLMGILAALWLGVEEPGPYVDSVLAGAAGRTGRLPMAFLRAAGRGEVGQAWHRLVDSIARGDTRGVLETATIVLGAGHTSGSDALFGFCMALGAIGRQSGAGAQFA